MDDHITDQFVTQKLKLCVMVMAPLSAYLVSEPLGLTLGSQCALETVKMDLLFEELLFVQNS